MRISNFASEGVKCYCILRRYSDVQATVVSESQIFFIEQNIMNPQIENICRHAAFDTNFKSILFRDSQLNEFIVDCTSLNLSKQINRND